LSKLISLLHESAYMLYNISEPFCTHSWTLGQAVAECDGNCQHIDKWLPRLW